MIDFIAYNKAMQNNANFANSYKNSQDLDIIISTLKKGKHNMLVKEDFACLGQVYNEFDDLDKADLIDLMEYEKELWTSL